jgi:hypothetical protein
MNRNIIILLVLVLVVIAFYALFYSPESSFTNEPVQSEADTSVRTLVGEFASKLKNVSLLLPPAELGSQLAVEYGPFITPELLTAWQEDPAKALGRNVSSPWPDRIEIVSVSKQGDTSYKVEGNVIEISSADKPTEPATTYPVTLTVEEREGKWLIASAQKGDYVQE